MRNERVKNGLFRGKYQAQAAHETDEHENALSHEKTCDPGGRRSENGTNSGDGGKRHYLITISAAQM